MRAMGLMMLPAVALAIDAVQEQDLKDFSVTDQAARARSQWRCGNTVGKDNDNGRQIRAAARIRLLRQKSLDYLRTDKDDIQGYIDSKGLTPTEEENYRNERSRQHFSNLHCADYISRYLNRWSEKGQSGVCLKDASVGMQWESVLEQDRLARENWEFFGTENGYQRSAPAQKDVPADDENGPWGSGRSGSSPADWCSAYMKEMLCHVAFPQFAGTDAELELQTPVVSTTENFQQLVRPVAKSNCEGMMNTCNRRQPKPYKGQRVSWLINTGNDGNNALDEVEHDMDNTLYCNAWNRGLHVAVAGTGVGAGPDEDEERFTADWDASSTLSPLGLLAVVLAVLATLL